MRECTCPRPTSREFDCTVDGCKKTLLLWTKCQEGDNEFVEAWKHNTGPGQNKSAASRRQRREQDGCIQKKQVTPRVFRLGDNIEAALKTVGITSERVSAWLGRKCGCPERVRRLNALGAWTHRVLTGKTENAEKYLEELIGDSKKNIEGQ